MDYQRQMDYKTPIDFPTADDMRGFRFNLSEELLKIRKTLDDVRNNYPTVSRVSYDHPNKECIDAVTTFMKSKGFKVHASGDKSHGHIIYISW